MTRFKLPVEQVWCSVFEDDDEALAIWRDEVLPVLQRYELCRVYRTLY